ncbi:DNA-binding protein [Candidatus Thalassolituus haligoni]|uniref:DNA-binding protein n=1 Tax=Candidatus Thalassolituus haligoni TaxID=3100113 RepID=UPI0035187915|tara:strand:- start:30829 stop:31884 length:1056 start_codon:yes stop_codon:yes gene_type:complete
MARAGVTYHDIAKAAEAVKTQGQEPTVDRVREHLGTGSKSTIAPLLKRWRSDNGEAAAVSGLPNDLVEVVKSLHERVQQMADHRIEQARREFEALNEELRNELTQANNAIAQLTARQQDLENQAERLSKEKSEQSQSLEDVRVSLANAESQRDEALTRANDLKESVSELKQENRDIRDHFEHYQQRTAEDRQQEREQFHLVSRGLKDQIQDLQLRLSQADSKASELVDANEWLQRHTHELEQANAIQKGTLDRQVADIQKLEHQLNDASAKSREQQHKSEQLVDNIAALTSQKADVDKQVAVLSQAFETTKADLIASQNRVEVLSDEYKLILQEKAVIQGQFKQLQESLSR